EGVIPVDPDTWLGTQSLAAARFAAGAVCAGVDDVFTSSTRRVFCAVRPPGHHAERDSAMGFCLFNSVSIGALKALQEYGASRVAILDFDVHHGNGTVDIFKDQPEVLVCSTFQHPYYPNRQHDVIRPNIIHSPLAAGTDGSGFRQAVENDWLPALAAHQPDLILVSAGFDAHALDPLAQLNLDNDDFVWVTQLIVDCAERYASGRVVSTLEGGYDLATLNSCVEDHLHALNS
ncbi:MAG: histone deacetylase family protein, partial [Pseudomonadota bacterium]